MHTFTYLTLFTFKLEPTDIEDAAEKPNFEFLAVTPPPPSHPLKKLIVNY